MGGGHSENEDDSVSLLLQDITNGKAHARETLAGRLQDVMFRKPEKNSEYLRSIAPLALDPSLEALLKSLKLTSISLDLIRIEVTCESQLSTRLVKDHQLPGVSNEARELLLGALETRGRLEALQLAREPWAAQLWTKCPCLETLRQMSIRELRSSLVDAQQSHIRVVESLWREGNSFRETLDRYGLSVEEVEDLEGHGIRGVGDIEDSILESLLQKWVSNGKDVALAYERAGVLKAVAHNGSPEKEADRVEQEIWRRKQASRTAEAKAQLELLRGWVASGQDLTIECVVERVERMAALLTGVDGWRMDRGRLEGSDGRDVRQQAASLIVEVEAQLSLCESALGLPASRADEGTVSNASDGLVLYGIHHGASLDMLRTRPERPVLAPLLHCPVANVPPSSRAMFRPRLVRCSDARAADAFLRTVSLVGKSIAESTLGAGWTFDCADATQDERTRSVSCVVYVFMPCAWFRLHKDLLRLSVGARSNAATVSNIERATQFLRAYGSHVPTGLHVLGGVYCLIVTVSTALPCSRSTLLRLAEQLVASVEPMGYAGFGAPVSGVFVEKVEVDGALECDEATMEQPRWEVQFWTHGPPVSCSQVSQQLLVASEGCRQVVDRGGPEGLVPVWDILASEGLAAQADLLRAAWVEQLAPRLEARSVPAFALDFDDAQSVGSSSAQKTQLAYDFCPTMTGRIREGPGGLTNLLQSSLPADLPHTPDASLTFLHVAYELAHRYGFNDSMVDLVNTRAFADVITRVAANCKQWSEAASFLRRMLNSHVRRLLESRDVALDAIVQDMLAMSGADSPSSPDRLAHLESAPLVSLPAALRSKCDEPGMSSEARNQRARNLIVNSLDSQPPLVRDGLLALLRVRFDFDHKYGFSTCGDLAPTAVTAKKIGEVACFLDEIISPPSPADLPRSLHCIFDAFDPLSDSDSAALASLVVSRHLLRGDMDWLDDFLRRFGCEWTPDVGFQTFTFAQGVALASELKSRLVADSVSTPRSTTSGAAQSICVEQRCGRGCITLADFATDSNARTHNPCLHFVDVLRSRQDLSKAFPPRTRRSRAATPNGKCLAGLVRDVTYECVLSAQMELFRLLLDRRCMVPLITHHLEAESLKDALHYHMEALRFQMADSKSPLCLLDDTAMPRVAVIRDCDLSAESSSELVKELLGVNPMGGTCRCGNGAHGAVMAELGIGRITGKTTKQETPCLVLSVTGDFTRLSSFVRDFADVLIVESATEQISNEVSALCRERVPRCRWRLVGRAFDVTDDDAMDVFMEGPIADVRRQLQEHLWDTVLPSLQSTLSIPSRKPLRQLDSGQLVVDYVDLSEVARVVARHNFEASRAMQFPLQDLFGREMQQRWQCHHEKDALQRQSSHRAAEDLRKMIEDLSTPKQHGELVTMFRRILAHPDRETRTLAVLELDYLMGQRVRQVRALKLKVRDLCWDQYSKVRNLAHRERWLAAQRDYVEHAVALEHLWRELSHIYAARPRENDDLPTLAAQHMLDGFPLEGMDGDAGMPNVPFIKAILERLYEMTRTASGAAATVITESTLGSQSTGKSTLINTCFGLRMRTSVGQSTRGVFMQLLRAYGREYDYKLVLDTEGVRSAELAHLEMAHQRDTRIGVFALLMASSCLVCFDGEDSSCMRNLLPIVLFVFKNALNQEGLHAHVHPMVFFVFSRIDPRQTDRMDTSVNHLLDFLREQMGKLFPSSNWKNDDDMLRKLFDNFQYQRGGDASDVHFIGSLDAPDSAYGERVAALREHVAARVSAHRSKRSFRSTSELFHLVSLCLMMSNVNHASLIDALDAFELRRLHTQHQMDFTRRLHVALSNTLDEITRMTSNELSTREKQQLVWASLHTTLVPIRSKCAYNFSEALKEPRWARWREAEQEGLARTMDGLMLQAQRTVEQAISTKVEFVGVVNTYLAKMRGEILAHARVDLPSLNFDAIFNRVIQEAQRSHGPSAGRVQGDVVRLYDQTLNGHGIPPLGPVSGGDKDVMAGGSSGGNLFTSFLGGLFRNMKGPKKEEVMQACEEVRKRMREVMQEASRFQPDVVATVCDMTQEVVKHMDADTVRKVHRWMRHELIEQGRAKQESWDTEHNIAGRLRAQCSQLQVFFDAVKKGVGETDLLVLALTQRLEAMDAPFALYVQERMVSAMVQDAVVLNSRLVQALVDKDLLDLLEAGKKREVISAVGDMPTHYRSVIRRYAAGLVDAAKCREEVKASLMTCLGLSCDAATSHLRESPRILRGLFARLGDLLRRRTAADTEAAASLEKEVDGVKLELATMGLTEAEVEVVMSNVAHDSQPAVAQESLLDSLAHALASRAFCNGLSRALLAAPIAAALSGLTAHEFEKVDDYDKVLAAARDKVGSLSLTVVMDRVADGAIEQLKVRYLSDNVGPRCEERCPHCGMNCVKKHSHKDRHDTHHQPRGLGGGVVLPNLEASHSEGSLMSLSCWEAVRDAYLFKHGQEWVPYSKFSEKFPSWAQPSPLEDLSGVCHVRQRVLYDLNIDLANHYGVHPCPAIPPEFERRFDHMREELQRFLERH